MLFEASDIFSAIKEKSTDTPNRTSVVINSGKGKINVKNDKEQTYFHLVAHSYENDDDAAALVPVVFQLSNAGLDVNAADIDGNTALHVAAKTPGSRRLIRAFILVGMDLNAVNLRKQTSAKLAKMYPENAQIIKYFECDLWKAVRGNVTDTVEKLSINWCKIDQYREEKSIVQLSAEVGNNLIKMHLAKNETTNEFVHYCLAGDRQKMRPYFKRTAVNINAASTSFVDSASGEFVNLPLLGEVALLGLNSVVRKLLRKKANMDCLINKRSLFLYVLENILPIPKFYETIAILADNIDFSKNKRERHAILDAAYEKKIPIDVLRVMTANGLDVFAVDEKGHFLRDRILIKHGTDSPKKLEKELAYPDNILIDMAKNGCTDIITTLINKNYDYLAVATDDAGSVREGLTKSMGMEKAASFLDKASQDQHLFRDLMRVIEVGHLAQVKKLLTSTVLKMTDRVGRTLVHKAVLFERRHVLRHLIKVNPRIACVKDEFGRTSLFYACLGEDSDDIILTLKTLGCKMDDVDGDGESPSSLMDLSARERKARLSSERSTDFGLDTYLYFKYLDIKEAIRAGNVDRLEEIRAHIYKDIFVNDMMKKMYQTDPPQRCILQFAVDAKRDNIAKYLLTLGMNWDVTYTDGDGDVSLLEAAARKDMESVVSYIRFQMEKQDKYKELLQKLKNKGVVKNVKNNSSNNKEDSNASNVDGTEDGTSCTVQ